MIDAGKRGFSWLRIVLLRLGDSRSASDDSFYGEYLLKQDVDDSLHDHPLKTTIYLVGEDGVLLGKTATRSPSQTAESLRPTYD